MPSPTTRSADGSRPARVEHDTSHVRDLDLGRLPAAAAALGRRLAGELADRMAILGVFDEGCMGMYNAIIDDEYLNPIGHLQGAAQPVRAGRRDAPGDRRARRATPTRG